MATAFPVSDTRTGLDPLASFLTFLVFGLAVAVCLPVMLLLRAATWPFDPGKRVVGRTLRLCAVVVARSCPLWRIRIEGQWPRGRQRAYVVVANHESMIDPFLLSHLPREMKWFAKASAFRLPWVGLMLRLAGDIPVVRGDHESGAAALQDAARYLALGVPVFLFPEGTRSRDGKMLPFKTGAFRLAVENGCPILPVVINGTFSAMHVGSPWLHAATLRARILPPVEVQGLGPSDVSALMESVRSRIDAERTRMRRGA